MLNLRGEIPAREDVDALSRAGFFVEFAKQVFENPLLEHLDNFGWGNTNAKLIAWYIQEFGVTDEVARAISKVFRNERYHPTTAAGTLKQLFQNNAQLHADLVSAVTRLTLPPPDALI